MRKSMEILVALGDIFGADSLIKVGSVQVAGVSYHNLGDAGLEFLNELAKDGKVRVLTTLNPAGISRKLEAARHQRRLRCQTKSSYRCLPANGHTNQLHMHTIPHRESTKVRRTHRLVRILAVTFANSVLGAKTNREGGPSALGGAFVGKTPCYGLPWMKTEFRMFT